MKITVWDDEPGAAMKWKTQLEEVLDDLRITVQAPRPEEIEGELHVLHERRKMYLESDNEEGECAVSELDDTDVLVVDNDLFDLPNLNDFSAETVAARAGVYTRCGYIVVLNLSPDVDFDLTLLGHPGSKADLHINDRFVADRGLWRECPKDGGTFRPWHWPLLLGAVDRYRSRVEDLVELLESNEMDQPILDYFRFGRGTRNRLSRSARAFLHPTVGASEVSFRCFVKDNANAVGVKDGRRILERNDIARIAQIGARRISKWLGRYVVGPQDILTDFPHLVEKMPFIIPVDKRECLKFWNSCAQLEEAPVALAEAIGIERFQMTHWFDRPVFWTDGMETEENIDKVLDALDANPGGLVFCEDSSAFHRAEVCDQFVAAHNSISDRRFVRWLTEEGEDIRYGPQSRLAM